MSLEVRGEKQLDMLLVLIYYSNANIDYKIYRLKIMEEYV
jgi:hypothetical protein